MGLERQVGNARARALREISDRYGKKVKQPALAPADAAPLATPGAAVADSITDPVAGP
jgi:hypothetical protein